MPAKRSNPQKLTHEKNVTPPKAIKPSASKLVISDNGNRMRISSSVATKLAEHVEAYFKCQFSHNIDDNYSASSIHVVANQDNNGRVLSASEKLDVLGDFCQFLDDATKMTITDVAKQYGRVTDALDKHNTIEDGTNARRQNIHFSLVPINGQAKCSKHRRLPRIHGYYSEGGVFIVTRLDWAHRFHQKKR